MNYEGTRIDDHSRVILSYIWRNGRTATTSDITSETSIDDKDRVRYRFKKLEDAGLLDSEVVDKGHYDVTQVEMTDKCIESVRKGKFGDLGDITIDFDEAEAQREANMRRIQELEDQVDNLEDTIETNSEYMTAVIQAIDDHELVRTEEILERVNEIQG